MEINIALIVGILLVVVGLGIMFISNKPKSAVVESNQADTKNGEGDGDDAEKAAKRKERAEKHMATLEQLVCPSNIPADLPIYFGSQSGTAEKFCQTLEEEAHFIGVQGAKVVDFNNFDKE